MAMIQSVSFLFCFPHFETTSVLLQDYFVHFPLILIFEVFLRVNFKITSVLLRAFHSDFTSSRFKGD